MSLCVSWLVLYGLRSGSMLLTYCNLPSSSYDPDSVEQNLWPISVNAYSWINALSMMIVSVCTDGSHEENWGL
jgi:hypothetical protein